MWDGLLEAGWLSAVVVAPLLFNEFASPTYENAPLIRSVALLVAAAGVAGFLARWFSHATERRLSAEVRALPAAVRWVLLAAVSVALATLLATGLSVLPSQSWWGSYSRRQGAFTLLAYLTIFLVVAFGLRRRDQLERLISTMVLTSVPITLYAILQAAKLDPYEFPVGLPPYGTLGNSAFLGGYLVMVIPLTTYALTSEWLRLGPAWASARTAVLSVALLGQLLALALSSARSALLGLAVAAVATAVLAGASAGRKRVAQAVTAAGL
ncbi:MAG TPA: hypothetical protein VFS62_04680, partial [Chloroflexota bacterium]|nr:hypothetical protein [Chloroflexota bacterium]